MVVITDDASDFEGLELYNPDKFTYKTETFEDIESMINKNGYVEVPITDPEHLVRIDITGDVTSSAGSSWGTAGCAVCINAVSEDGTEFWTSKSYSLKLGKGTTASVEFDGTLTNKEDIVNAVVADGKVELQKWWDSSEKMEQEIEDTISVDYKKIEVVYEYDNDKEPDEVDIDEFMEFVRDNSFVVWNILTQLNAFNDIYLLKNKNTLISIDSTGLNRYKAEYVEEYIDEIESAIDEAEDIEDEE